MDYQKTSHYLSFDPFYFDPDEDVEVSDRTCWSVYGPDVQGAGRFGLHYGDAESWECLRFLCDEPEEDTGYENTAPGGAFWRPTYSEAYPWLGWVHFHRGGLDV